MQNFSCENEFYLHDNKKSFSEERFCTWPRFKTEACGISEMAYLERELKEKSLTYCEAVFTFSNELTFSEKTVLIKRVVNYNRLQYTNHNKLNAVTEDERVWMGLTDN